MKSTMLLMLFSCSTSSLVVVNQVEWQMLSSTYTKEILKIHCGKFPSHLESNCKYMVAFCKKYPIALFPFRDVSIDRPIAINYYCNRKAIKDLKVKNKMWSDFQDKYDTLPLLPNKFKKTVL